MLRRLIFFTLFSFSEWLWAGSSFSSGSCSVKPVKKTMSLLQKKLYVDLGVSKTLSTHLSSDQIILEKNARMTRNFGIYPIHRGMGILPDTLQIGIGYAWSQNSIHGGLLPYMSLGVEYRKNNPVEYPLTFTAKYFDIIDGKLDKSDTYELIPLQASHLFATLKFNPIKIGCVFPYISAGLGVSWIQTHSQQFGVSVLDKGEKRSFHAQLPVIEQTNLGFRLGSGLDFALTQNLLMSIGYSYNNLGNLTVHKPSADIQVPSKYRKDIDKVLNAFRTMYLKNLTTHNIEFSFRYLFS